MSTIVDAKLYFSKVSVRWLNELQEVLFPLTNNKRIDKSEPSRTIRPPTPNADSSCGQIVTLTVNRDVKKI